MLSVASAPMRRAISQRVRTPPFDNNNIYTLYNAISVTPLHSPALLKLASSQQSDDDANLKRVCIHAIFKIRHIRIHIRINLVKKDNTQNSSQIYHVGTLQQQLKLNLCDVDRCQPSAKTSERFITQFTMDVC